MDFASTNLLQIIEGVFSQNILKPTQKIIFVDHALVRVEPGMVVDVNEPIPSSIGAASEDRNLANYSTIGATKVCSLFGPNNTIFMFKKRR